MFSLIALYFCSTSAFSSGRLAGWTPYSNAKAAQDGETRVGRYRVARAPWGAINFV